MGSTKSNNTGGAVTSRQVAAIASRVLNGKKFSFEEIKALAASCLAQVKRGALIVMAFMLVSCTIKPFIATTPSGTKVTSLGGSIATKSEFEIASIRTADGAVIQYETGRHDETVVPSNQIKAGVLKNAISVAGHSTDVATKAVASKAGTTGGAMSAVPVAAAGIGAAVISRPQANPIPLPVMEVRREQSKTR